MSARDEIVAWLDYHGPTSVRKLMRATGLSQVAVSTTLHQLQDEGRARATRGQGVTQWELTTT